MLFCRVAPPALALAFAFAFSGQAAPTPVKLADSSPDALTFNQSGSEKYAKGDLDAAISDLAQALADYTRAIKLNPNDDQAYYNRAIARNDKGDADGALADYDQAIRIDPKYTDAYVNRAEIKAGQENWDAAIADLNRAIALDP